MSELWKRNKRRTLQEIEPEDFDRQLSKPKSGNRFSKNDYNRNVGKKSFLGKKRLLDDEDDLKEEEEEVQELEEQEDEELNDEIGKGGVINNIINTKGSGYKHNKGSGHKSSGKKKSATKYGLIKRFYEDISDYKSRLPLYLDSFIKKCDSISVNEKYEEDIKKAEEEKKKVAMIKAYTGASFSAQFSTPIMRIVQNMDANGKMSASDFAEAFSDTGPLGNLRKSLSDAYNTKDKDGKPSVPPPMQTFLKKSIEGYDNIVNNCGFSLNPSKIRNNLGIAIRDVGDVYEKTSIFVIIAIIIHDFVTFSNFFQNLVEAKIILNSIYDDVDIYYDIPYGRRQKIVDRMNNKISKVEYLFSKTFFLKKETFKAIADIKSDLNDAMDIKVSANDIIVMFIKTYGQAAVSSVDMSLIDKGVYNSILSKLSSAVKESTGLGEKESLIVAENILNKGDEEKVKKEIVMTEEQSKHVSMFFKGMLDNEYKEIEKELKQVGHLEDAKIIISRNHQSVDALIKRTDTFVNAANLLFSRCKAEINELLRRYRMGGSGGILLDAKNVSSELNGIWRQILSSVEMVANNLKERVFEYIDDSNERKKVLEEKLKKFQELQEDLRKAVEDKLCKDGKPKAGKEAEVEKIFDDINNMKEIVELSFKCYGSVKKVVDDFKKKPSPSLQTLPNNLNHNMFSLIGNHQAVQNDILNKMIERDYSNSRNQRDDYRRH